MTRLPRMTRSARRAAAAVMVLALASACVAPPGGLPRGVPPVSEQPVAPAAPEERAIAYGLDREPAAAEDDPRALVERAENTSADQAAALLLRAIPLFIRQGQLSDAQTQITRLQYLPMTRFQRHSLVLHRARLAQVRGRHAHTLELLRTLEQSPTLGENALARLLSLQADSRHALGRDGEAVTALLLRDKLLEPGRRADNQRRLLEYIESLDPLGRLLLRENPANEAVDGWIALNEALQFEAPGEQAAAIRQWRALYPEHPAQEWLWNRHLSADGSARYRHIALLLPLTSPFGEAARAFYEGFMASRNDAPPARRPMVSLYDVGDDPQLLLLYYQAAVNDGADFVVGPLGRRAVNEMFSGADLQLPMLVIGAIPEDKIAPHLYGISLSPEQEARQAAGRAFADGHRQGGILSSNSLWGRRVADAFTREWELLGGTVVDAVPFTGDAPDHSRVIRQFLGLDQSIRRERVLSARLGINLEFTPRRRDDLDFLFLAANAGQARSLVPQLRFFQAHDLALYATSSVYSGKPAPAVDADLDGIIFGDMNWILDAAVLPEPEPEPDPEPEPAPELEAEAVPLAEPGTESPPEPPAATDGRSLIETAAASEPPPARTPSGRERGPYYHTELDRLYALGLESYQVIPGLETLRGNPRRRYYGRAMDLSVQADGNVLLHLTWARFAGGLPVAVPGAPE